jgi:hypothetical protein
VTGMPVGTVMQERESRQTNATRRAITRIRMCRCGEDFRNDKHVMALAGHVASIDVERFPQAINSWQRVAKRRGIKWAMVEAFIASM